MTQSNKEKEMTPREQAYAAIERTAYMIDNPGAYAEGVVQSHATYAVALATLAVAEELHARNIADDFAGEPPDDEDQS